MKHLLPSLLLVSLPLSGVAEEAAHDFRPPSREQVAMRMVVRQLLLKRYDADQNLRLDGEERHRLLADAHAARKEQALAFIRRFDVDEDGQLTDEERASMQQAMEERRRAHTIKAALPPPPPHPHAGRHAPRGRHHGPRPPRPDMGKDGRLIALMVHHLTMDAYDADQDGHLDTNESARLREDGAALYQSREAELLARFDADASGDLSEAELRRALHELHPRSPHHAEGSMPPLPPPPSRHPHGSLHRLLDTHFDLDVLLNLARPAAAAEAGESTPPCSPSTPSAT